MLRTAEGVGGLMPNKDCGEVQRCGTRCDKARIIHYHPTQADALQKRGNTVYLGVSHASRRGHRPG